MAETAVTDYEVVTGNVVPAATLALRALFSDDMALHASALSAAVVVLILLLLLTIAIYRLYLSPLAKFPGPKLAALTGLYEGYYDCIHEGGGRYYRQINEMHEDYGPIVRISPWELHIRDQEWSEIYKISRRAYKPEWYYRFLGSTSNVFTTVSHEQHRMRRDAIQAYFSPAAVARHEAEIERLVDKLIARLRDEYQGKEDRAVDLYDAFRCLATDVATAFAFRKPFGHLDSPDWEHDGNRAVQSFGRLGLFNRQANGLVMKVLRSIPTWLAVALNPGGGGVEGFFKQLAVVVNTELAAAKSKSSPRGGGRRSGGEGQGEEEEAQVNIIRQILNSSLPPEEKTPYRVAAECSSVTLAGTETTGSILAFTTFQLLSCDHPPKLPALQEELAQAQQKNGGKRLTYQELKELPYLTGVVNEGLRLHSVSGRLPRYDPTQGMTYQDWYIPKGTIVSTTPNDTHLANDIFPISSWFVPERWMDPSQRKRLSKYLLPFGRGTRSCLGMEIATMELYITFARLFGPDSCMDLELYDSKWQDVWMYHDFFSPFPKNKKGVRVFVR
ncbi:cytochrome P450 [Diplogelasinospora grovesii]|uniref:Cytochrome P450 n=1 Tax=Diplogelasinospora grovesii TaxID=303347 RepID=A0AAN6NE67_9PEZI|nr:cytochrome P450 [Diplogelasinospora grovesii]